MPFDDAEILSSPRPEVALEMREEMHNQNKQTISMPDRMGFRLRNLSLILISFPTAQHR